MFDNIEMVRKNSVYFKNDGNTVAHKEIKLVEQIEELQNKVDEARDSFFKKERGNGD